MKVVAADLTMEGGKYLLSSALLSESLLLFLKSLTGGSEGFLLDTAGEPMSGFRDVAVAACVAFFNCSWVCSNFTPWCTDIY